MKKVNVRLLISLLIVLFSVFFFILLFYHYRNWPHNNVFEESKNNASYSSTTTEQGKQVVDSSTGFSFLLPKNWEIEKMSKTMVVLAFSSSTYAKDNSESRCKIVFQSSKLPPQKHYNLDDIKNIVQEKISKIYPKATNLVFTTTVVRGNKVLETNFKFRNADSFDKFIVADILSGSNLFDFSGIFLNIQNENQEAICQKGIEQILETISIKK